MAKAPHLSLRKGELGLLKMANRGYIKWENSSLQTKLYLFTSAYRDEVLEEWQIEEFANELGISLHPTRQEIVEALKDDGFIVDEEEPMVATL